MKVLYDDYGNSQKAIVEGFREYTKYWVHHMKMRNNWGMLLTQRSAFKLGNFRKYLVFIWVLLVPHRLSAKCCTLQVTPSYWLAKDFVSGIMTKCFSQKYRRKSPNFSNLESTSILNDTLTQKNLYLIASWINNVPAYSLTVNSTRHNNVYPHMLPDQSSYDFHISGSLK